MKSKKIEPKRGINSTFPISQIRTDSGGLVRTADVKAVVLACASDGPLTCVELFYDAKAKTYWISEGRHVVIGAKRAKRKTLMVNVRFGTRDEADAERRAHEKALAPGEPVFDDSEDMPPVADDDAPIDPGDGSDPDGNFDSADGETQCYPTDERAAFLADESATAAPEDAGDPEPPAEVETTSYAEWALVPIGRVDYDLRARKRQLDFDKVRRLAASIRVVGLLNPITVTTDMHLVAGLHRVEACRLAGMKAVPARIVTLDALRAELAEIDENLIRNELSVLEQGEHMERREEILDTLGLRAKRGDNQHSAGPTNMVGPPKTTADIAAEIGVSATTAKRRMSAVKKLTPEVRDAIRHTDLADNAAELGRLSKLPADEQRAAADRIVSGEVSSVRAAKNRAVAEEIRSEPQPLTAKGPFRVLVADPPWKYDKRSDDATHRAGLPYPDMTVEEICAMQIDGTPVRELAEDDCVLWLWTTNAFMRDAFRVLDAWGFQEKTILTWGKDRMGTGDWLRGKTEHCILAVRGKPTVVLTNQTTLLTAPLREHSRKPDEFYAMVDALCPGSKLEIFGREQREGWIVWGAEDEKFRAEAAS